ncbi:hypothetical protein [Halococcus hamelinensis]|uniref:Uncharacterized protein n=1 Tax=Halococcus hamelinensis 100A6 TaxID=1132509 RepID=M0LRJ7_9EURY|nr:hypothetical protein [Halococcus hamelinensis]EMA35723.1 hypothetical protein C447_16234 [Halococcus hamelinensis 100A6]
MDRGVVLGILGGVVTALVGLLRYVVVPLLTDEYNAASPALVPFYKVISETPIYHLETLTVPSFLAVFFAVVLLRRWGRSSRTDDLKVVGGVLAVPLLTAFGCYLVGAVWVAVFPLRTGTSLDPASLVVVLTYFTVLGLAIGFAFAVVAFAVVGLTVGIGVAAGYLSAWAVLRISS